MHVIETVEKLKKETVALRKEMIIIKTLIKQQNDIIKNLLEQAQGAEISTKPFSKPSKKWFPIMTQEQLDQFESEVNISNRNEIIYEARLLTKSDGLAKSLKLLLGEHLIDDYNMEGYYNKKRLFNYHQLLDVLFRAVEVDGLEYNDFIKEMRKGMKIVKKKLLKCNEYKKRTKIEFDNEDDEDDDEDDE